MTLTELYISDLEIQALVDNQLNWEDAKYALAAIEQSPWAKKRYDELILQKKMLRDWWNNRQES